MKKKCGLVLLLFLLTFEVMNGLAVATEKWEGNFKGKTSQDENVSLSVFSNNTTLNITYLLGNGNPTCTITNNMTISGPNNGSINSTMLTASYSSGTDSWSGEYHFKNIICGSYSYSGDVPWNAKRFVTYPNISVNPTSSTINAVPNVKINQIFYIQNTGDADLEIANITQKSKVNEFDIINDNCSGKSISPGDSCIFTVTFLPTNLNSTNTIVQIRSNDPDTGILNIPVTGIGIPSITPIYNLLLSSAKPNDGSWSGTTNQSGRIVSFDVASSNLSNLFISYNACGGTLFTTLVDSTIINNSFTSSNRSVNCLGNIVELEVSGTFTGNNTCEGTWILDGGNEGSGTWTATP